MDKFVIQGGAPLQGEIADSGAKNSALPVLAACLLTDEPVMLHRIPRVRDIRTMERLLVRHRRARVDIDGEVTVQLPTERIVCPEAPYDLVKTMRASSLVLGPLVARRGARACLHAGRLRHRRAAHQSARLRRWSNWAPQITQAHGYVEADAPDGLQGATVHFDRITVTGTEDLLMAAVLAQGETVIENAAREPEVVDLAAC